jgi:hypothetical protein
MVTAASPPTAVPWSSLRRLINVAEISLMDVSFPVPARPVADATRSQAQYTETVPFSDNRQEFNSQPSSSRSDFKLAWRIPARKSYHSTVPLLASVKQAFST